MKSITAVIATQAKDYKEFENRPIFKSLQKQYDLQNLFNRDCFQFVIVKDNKKGLSKLYNEFLYNKKYKNDILLFVHDDVELEDIFLVEKLSNSPYVVTGLAGTKKIDLNKPPAWHLMSNRADTVGEVAHTTENKVWTTVFGPTNSRSLLIDGLFIAVDVNKALEKKICFDEDFDFHHYDLAFCLDCNNKKASVGILPIRVVHHGLGDSMNTPEWTASAKIFSAKYNKPS